MTPLEAGTRADQGRQVGPGERAPAGLGRQTGASSASSVSLCRVTNDVDTWRRLAALLPPAEAQEFRDCWSIGEQETGLGLLVSGILIHGVTISEGVRAQLSVLAEAWGERETLTPRILQCRSDGQPACDVTLIEHENVPVAGDAVLAGPALAELVRVPWILCTRCGQMLMRLHAREDWGELSYLANHYAITTPDRTAVAQLFSGDCADEAFTKLLQMCGQSSIIVAATGFEPGGRRAKR